MAPHPKCWPYSNPTPFAAPSVQQHSTPHEQECAIPALQPPALPSVSWGEVWAWAPSRHGHLLAFTNSLLLATRDPPPTHTHNHFQPQRPTLSRLKNRGAFLYACLHTCIHIEKQLLANIRRTLTLSQLRCSVGVGQVVPRPSAGPEFWPAACVPGCAAASHCRAVPESAA